MALADTAKLVVDLSLKGNFAAQLKSSEKSLTGFNRQITDTQGRAYKAGQQIGTGIKTGALIAAGAIGFLATQVGLGLRSLSELETVVAQSNAVLKSTKGVAGETAKSLRDLANKYESLNATIDDTVIQSGENLLLTFTNIRKKAFEPALKAALDLNTALGKGESGLTDTVRILGKALNDPAKGLTALQRIGIRFTDSQKNQIEAALKANDTFKAQSIILAELNKRFGGSFLAGGQTTAGKIAKFKDAIDDLQRALATALLPTIGKVADRLSKFLQDPKVVKTISDLGQSIADLFSDKNLAEGGKFLGTIFETAKAAAPVVQAAAVATLGAVKAAVGLFTSLPKEVQQLAIGAFAINKITGGLVTNIAGGLISSVLKQLVSGVVNVNGAVVNVNGAAGVGGLAGAVGGKGVLGTVASIATKVVIVGMVAEVASMIAGPIQDFGKNLHTAIFGSGGDPFSDFGKAWEDWRRNADWPFGQKNAPEWAGGKPSAPISTIGSNDSGAIRAIEHWVATNSAKTGKDDIVNLAQLQKSSLSFLRDQFREMLSHLSGAKTAAAIKQAIKEVELNIFGRGKGGVGGAQATIDALKKAIGNTHDPKLQASLRAELRRVEKQLNYRTIVQAQLKKADQIFHSSESTKRKIEELKGVQRSLSSKDLAAQHAVQAKIDALKRAETYAQRATTQAIKDKDLSVRVNTTVKTTTVVNARDVANAVVTFSKYFVTSQAGSGGKYAS